ncbi:MAG: ATPase, T2SS/T4P/T4SS family [Kiritimatiellaeota bacterium]|nr:ATPase, T2SS/T4P/T4SS family [Kiritimatiellota bacterium]
MLDPELVRHLPVEWARTHLVLPVRWQAEVGMLTCDPARLTVRDDLALLLGREVQPILAPRAEILRAIERCYFSKSDTTRELLRDMEEETPRGEPAGSRRDDLLHVADQAPVTQLVNLILIEALKARASDIHIEPFEQRLVVRYRVDGLLYAQASPPKHLEAALVSRLKVMARLDIAEKRLPQDGSARVRVGEREIDIRASTIPVAEGERVVLRLLNREAALLPLTALGMAGGVLERFRRLLREPHGVVLVTGPTGSGKTTTLYAALRELDTQHLNVMTIEDPIEYQIPGIGQIQVKPKIGLTFAEGLRHILRQDPDVMLVGETRDLETAEIIVRSALTGHLCFSTLHTNDALGAVVRLMDMGIEPYLLASSILGALAQRLVRCLCPECREPARLSAEERALLGPWAARLDDGFWRVRGCPRCLEGYRGRTGIYELMTADAELLEAIRTRADLARLGQLARAAGMRSLWEDGLDKVRQGVTSLPELLRAAGHPDPAP